VNSVSRFLCRVFRPETPPTPIWLCGCEFKDGPSLPFDPRPELVMYIGEPTSHRCYIGAFFSDEAVDEMLAMDYRNRRRDDDTQAINVWGDNAMEDGA